MNLKALFNFNYFKENLKKSKGLLAFFFGVVPLLNIVMLITNRSALSTFNDISSITCIGLYVVPIIFAISLMGFIFSKKSTDFVMSKPLNRKTIYLTNTIGGVITLTLVILLNAIIFGIVSLLVSSIIIPFELLVDYFLFWSISYIFVFAATMLAITIAGNSIGSFVLLFLIVFLYPFFAFAKFTFNDYYDNNNYIKCTDNTCAPKNYTCYDDKECEDELKNGNYVLDYTEEFGNSFTAPAIFLNSNRDTMYNTLSIIKMTILSITYLAIGFFTFKHRKMENNEISFYSEFLHYFVKTLVFIPICFVCYAIIIDGGEGSLLIAIVAALIFYLVYDLITRKGIYKFRKSMFICFVSFGILLGCNALYHNSIKDNHVYLDKIDSINFYHNGEYLTIKDEFVINELIKNTILGTNYNARQSMLISNKKYYYLNIAINKDIEKVINDYIYKRNLELAGAFNYNSIDYASNKIPVTKEFKGLVKDTMHYLKLEDLKSDSRTISVYDYHNHIYERVIVPYTINKDLTKYILNASNERFINFANNKDSNVYLSVVCDLLSEEEYEVASYVLNNNISSLTNYLKNNTEIVNKSNCTIYYYDEDDRSNALEIGDAEAFYKEFKKYEEKVKNTSEYQNIIKEYQERKTMETNTDYDDYQY